MAVGGQVYVKGLAEFRRDLRRTDREALKEVQAGTRKAAKLVAEAAARLAPRRTGRLAESYRGTTSGNRGIVYSNLVYAPIVEFGGTISPRGVDIKFRRQEPVARALALNTERIVDSIGDGIDRAASRTGW